MSWKRKILAVVFPPFAVADKGCGTYLLAFFFTCLGWIPGVIYAFVVLKLEQRKQGDKAGNQVSKPQSKSAAGKINNASRGISPQSPFNSPSRTGDEQQNNNNASQSWQGW